MSPKYRSKPSKNNFTSSIYNSSSCFSSSLSFSSGAKLFLPPVFVLVVVFCFILLMDSLGQAEEGAGHLDELLGLEEEMKELKDVDKEELAQLSDKEQEIQQELFDLSREIERLESEQQELEAELEESSDRLDEAREEKEKQEEKIEELETELGEVFRSLQRRGPVSYLQIILGAEDLRDFLQRVNIMIDVFSNVNEMFSGYLEEQERLAEMEQEISAEVARLYELEKELEENIETAYARREEQEEILAQVQEELYDYQAQLEALEQAWVNHTRPFLIELAGVLDRFIEDDKLDEDKIHVGGTFFNPVAELTQANFNSFFHEEEELPDLEFEFLEDQVRLELPGGNLTFIGDIVATEDTVLSFEIEEARFFGIPLGEEVIRELTQDIELGFDFGAEMGNYRIDEVDVREEKLILKIAASFF